MMMLRRISVLLSSIVMLGMSLAVLPSVAVTGSLVAGTKSCRSATGIKLADPLICKGLAFYKGTNITLVDPGAPWSQLNIRPLREIEPPALPAGFRLRNAGEVDRAAIVALERAAWHPSRFTLESLLNVRSTWPYRDDLAVFVEAPDGTLVASALVWYDEINRTAELEPVGTDPGYRQLGLGRAVSVFGLHQARAVGATDGVVSCRGDENYPVPRRLYGSIGFRELTRDLVFAK